MGFIGGRQNGWMRDEIHLFKCREAAECRSGMKRLELLRSQINIVFYD
jgi:hypothetical protein